jgi:HD-GYP domain-containing protein (c-di-GMP phosphodiesterase class II)
MYSMKILGKKHFLYVSVLCVICLVLNYGLSQLVILLNLPLYLDNIGTIVCGALVGGLPSYIVAILTNVFNGITNINSLYYSAISIMIAFFTGVLSSKGMLKKKSGILLEYLMLVFCGGFLGSILTWGLHGLNVGSGIGGPLSLYFYGLGWEPFLSQLTADVLIDMLDKFIVLLVSLIILRFLPDKIEKKYRYGYIYCKKSVYIPPEKTNHKWFNSLRNKATTVYAIINAIAGIALLALTIPIYRENTLNYYSELVKTESGVVANEINADEIESYIKNGDTYGSYQETKAKLKEIYSVSSFIKYCYVYKINEDNITVIFDVDTPDTPANQLNDTIHFDESFAEYLDILKTGKDLGKSIISKDTFGYLITYYTPCIDSNGVTQCYAGVDIDVSLIETQIDQYTAKAVSIIVAIEFLVISISYYFIDRNVLSPLRNILKEEKDFEKVGEKNWLNSDEYKCRQYIKSNNELDELYQYIDKSKEIISIDFNKIEEETAALLKMEKSVVMALANVVEARDSNTGNHIARTSFYVKVIANELLREGKYPEILTRDYVEKLVSAAPLHDIGKIVIPDSILNKPGKLTDEEFEIMRTHTTEGKKIIDMALEGFELHSYLDVAKDLAVYHHEWYNGKGYAQGLKGDKIPLAARIMAVADVFDALISKRSYKEPFSYQNSIDILKKESGTHFDPTVVEAFLKPDCQEQVKRYLKIKDNDNK